MKKLAIIFVIAVLVPSLVLAWLAVRSLRNQQFVLERQQTLLYQGVTDQLAERVQEGVFEEQKRFVSAVESLLQSHSSVSIPHTFDQVIRTNWPLAQVGFTVTVNGQLLSPSPVTGPDVRSFLVANSSFLGNREAAEVYFNNAYTPTQTEAQSDALQKVASKNRNVFPQQQMQQAAAPPMQQQISKFAPSETEFRNLIGSDTEGMIARFLENKLHLLVWHRPSPASDLVYGAQVNLDQLTAKLRSLVALDPVLSEEICVALLDDSGKPVALSKPGFSANWKRPFVASEISEELPHWEVTAYLVDPDKLQQMARTTNLTIGLLIALLVSSIGTGGWLIVADINRQLALARQKTDFVSNVSHELKTPLTSIRMFSELLAEGRVTEPARQKSYLQIIGAEASRLTRLINNVLDFARIERGEKTYQLRQCDLVEVVREVCETFRPHLEENGFSFQCRLSEGPVPVHADRDAIAQVIVNLLSNAEKYSEQRKELELELLATTETCEVQVRDRGSGVPRGCEEKIFEQFFRAHDSLDSGTQGSGLGLTLARQITRAHGGDLTYQARGGGGSCFTMRLPMTR